MAVEADGPDELFAPFFARLVSGDLAEARFEPASAEQLGLLERLGRRRAESARYRSLREIGRGGMGEVCEAEDLELHRSVAVKTLSAPHPDAGAIDRFLREAQVTGQLDHPGIVPVHELGVDAEGRPFFTMQLVRGQDLATLLSRSKRPAEWTTPRFLQALLRVCEAMAFAHERGVLHRDLKPANIMVGRFGEVFVMDWGLAKLVASPDAPEAQRTVIAPHLRDGGALERTRVGDVMGTPSYMSPEQARGDIERLDARSDVYSIGAILYHVLTEAPPFQDRSKLVNEVLELVRDQRPTAIERLREDVAPELVAICERAMARDPAARYPSAHALGEDLRAFLEGRVVAAHRTGALVEIRKWIERNRLAAGVSAALIVALIVGVVVSSVLVVETRRAARRLQLQGVDYMQLRAQGLVASEPELWPPGPETLPALEAWVHEAEALPKEVAELLASLEVRGVEDPRVDALRRLGEDLERMADPQQGLLEATRPEHGLSVRARLALARTLAADSVESPAAVEAWRAARERIADTTATPRYAGVDLAPQVGLLPLGPDPSSGLLEFADLRTGRAPLRDPLTGELQIDAESALVLVLVPGGITTLGSSTDPEDARYVPGLSEVSNTYMFDAESPQIQVRLEAYFLSKYEVTQAQWLRWTGDQPSEHRPGHAPDGRVITALHPVERVSWDEAQRVLTRFGLTLPTEAQWEHAARAGTDTPWWTGADPEQLRHRVNLRDRGVNRRIEGGVKLDPELDYEDGWAVHAPVDVGAANPFGFVHVLGNVKEWCLDPRAPYGECERGAGGLALARSSHRVHRGGSYMDMILQARSAFRAASETGSQINVIGLRPARPFLP